MCPDESAKLLAQWSLVVAIFAAVVSLLAAGFAGWQAVTAHLDRTRPRPAALVLPPAKQGEPRTIKNEGGSAAHSVHIVVWGTPSTRWKRREAVRALLRGESRAPRLLGEPIAGGRVNGSLPAGETTVIDGFGPGGEMFGPPAKIGVGGIDLMYSPALATWKDFEGKARHAWIQIR
jgi:hypothetical protein